MRIDWRYGRQRIAGGQISGRISFGKKFNRAKRLHVLVTLALDMEYFKFFLASENIEIENSATEYLRNLLSHTLTDEVIDNADLRVLIVNINVSKTRHWQGNTAKLHSTT